MSFDVKIEEMRKLNSRRKKEFRRADSIASSIRPQIIDRQSIDKLKENLQVLEENIADTILELRVKRGGKNIHPALQKLLVMVKTIIQ